MNSVINDDVVALNLGTPTVSCNSIDSNLGTPTVRSNDKTKQNFGKPKVLKNCAIKMDLGMPTVPYHECEQVTYSVPAVTLLNPEEYYSSISNETDCDVPAVDDLNQARYNDLAEQADRWKEELKTSKPSPFNRVLHPELDPDFIEYLDEFSQIVNSGMEIISRNIQDYRLIVLERAVRDLNNAIVMIRHTRADVDVRLGKPASTPKVPPPVPSRKSMTSQNEENSGKASDLTKMAKLTRFYTFSSLLLGLNWNNAPINHNDDQ